MNENLKLIPKLDIFKNKVISVLSFPKNPMFNRYEHHGAHFVEIDLNGGEAKYWYIITLSNQTKSDDYSSFVLSDAKLSHWRETSFNNVLFYQEGTLNFFTCEANDFKEMCRNTKEISYDYTRFDNRKKKVISTKAHVIKVDYSKLTGQMINGTCTTVKDFDIESRMSWRPKSNKKCTVYINGVEKKFNSVKEAWATLNDGFTKLGITFVKYCCFNRHFSKKQDFSFEDFIISFVPPAPKEDVHEDERSESERTLSISIYNNTRYTECTADASTSTSEEKNKRLEELEYKYETSFDLSNDEMDELLRLREAH